MTILLDLFDLYARITLDTSDYEKGVKQSNDGFGKLKTGISNVTKVAAGIGAAVTTVSTLLAKAGIEAAAEVRAETSAFQQTFGDMADVATESIGRVADSSGILQTRLNTLGSQIYAFARASGGDATESMSLMERALTVAADAAAYYDMSVEQATETLQSFLKGNYENDAALGLSATETTRNAEAMELFGKKFQNLTEIQKQQTLLSMVEDAQALTGALGQASREADGWENVIGNLKESWRQLQARMGEPVLDTVKPVVKDATAALVVLKENWDEVEFAAERVAVVTGTVATTMAAIAAGQKIKSIATVFLANAEAIRYFSMESGAAALTQEVLAGTFSASEVAVGVLTGKISLATAAQTAWNKALSANPIGLVVAGAALLGVAIHKTATETSAAVDTLTESMVVQATTAEEAEASLSKLQARLLELESGDPTDWGAEKQREYEAVRQAIQQTEDQLAQFQQAQQEAAEVAADPVHVFNQATEQYAADATALYEKFVDTYEGIYDRVAGWFGPFEKAATTVKTNINDMMAAMQSQIDFNNAYNENLLKLEEYGLGGLSETLQECGANGAAYADAIVSAVEQAGGATTEGGQQIIQGFQDINQKVTESQGELTQTIALMNGELEAEFNSLAEKYGDSIADLDKSKEAGIAATNTFQAFLDGMNSKVPTIMSTMKSIGQQITSALQSGIGPVTITANVVTNGSAKSVDGSWATGLGYVPFDGYIAELHKGEAVLTAEEAAAWRAGKSAGGGEESSGGDVTINQYIETVPQTPVELASTTAAFFEQARWVM